MRLLVLILVTLLISLPAMAQRRGGGKVPVETARVAAAPLSERVTAIGTLISDESVTIRPEVAGRIVEIGFEEGKPVKKGDMLIKLDDALPRAELADAQARLDLAERNFKRTEELFSNKVATARSRDEAQSSLAIGTASMELARVKLAKYVLTAPFDGIAGLRLVSRGDYVSIGEDIVNLEAIDPIKADFRIAERFLPAIRTGQPIEVNVDAYAGQSFTGEVYAIDPNIDASGRSIIIRARIDNSEQLLRPGLFARIALIMETKPKALTVPEQAIVPRGENQFVYRVIEGKARQVAVRLGTRRAGQVEIVEGLDEGDVVITAGHQKIGDGADVAPIDPAVDGNSGNTASAKGKGA
ncbi:MAG: efflux RND transporter periplasmic adaptor subunit [Hyphomicrobiales bacterium]|nr:efflux RND transporter periplasmic adaptor subunit [Hyphomicrobiales bacterium]